MTQAADKPFDSFAKSNTSVMYLHLFVYSFPEVLTRVTGDLPSDMFSESNSGSQVKKRDKNGVKGKNTNLDRVQASIASKNNSIKFSVLADTAARLSTNLRGMKTEKRKLTKEFFDEACDGDRKVGKERIVDHFEKRTKNLSGDTDSFASMLDDLYQLEADIKCTELDAKEARLRMSSKVKTIIG